MNWNRRTPRVARTALTRSALATACAAAVVLLAACGQSGPTGADAPSTRAPKPPSSAPAATTEPSRTRPAEPSAEPGATVEQAARTTRSAGSARVDMEADLSVNGTMSRILGEGTLDFEAASGELTFTFDDGTTVAQIVTPDAVYVQLPDQPDQWYEAPLDELGLTPLGTGDPADSLDALTRLGAVTDEGPDDLDGVATTRYVGSVDVTDALAASGLSGEQVDAIGALLGDAADATVTAWVDDQDRVVQLQQDFALDGGRLGEVSSSTLVRFSDFGVEVDVVPPPGDQIVPAPEGLFGSRDGGADA